MGAKAFSKVAYKFSLYIPYWSSFFGCAQGEGREAMLEREGGEADHDPVCWLTQ